MKKILFYTNFPPPLDGQSVYSKLVFNSITNFDKKFVIRVSPETRHNLNVGTLSVRSLFGSFIQFIKVIIFLIRENIDVLYFVPGASNFGILRDIALIKIASLRIRKIVAHVHRGNLMDSFNNRFIFSRLKNFISSVDKFILLNEILYLPLEKYIPRDKVVFISNMIDPDVVADDFEINLKLTSKIKRRVMEIVFIGNMIKSKGYWDLAKALILLDSQYKFRAHFIGKWYSARDEEEFDRFLIQNNIYNKIRKYGQVRNRNVIKEVLLFADALILPTYYPIEAQPLVIIEGLNTANPIIATNHASIPTMVKNGINGFLVRPHDPHEICNSIMKLVDYTVWQRMAIASRKLYKCQYSSSKIVKELEEVIQI